MRPRPATLLAASIGAFSTISQIVLLREVLVVLAGTEVSIAVSLAAWLLGVGLGALLGGVAASRSRFPDRWVLVSLVGLAIMAPAAAIGIRCVHIVLGVQVGALLPPAEAIAVCLLFLTPASLGVGLSFAPLTRLATDDDVTLAAGRIYAVEAAGAVLGGGLFTFVLAGTVPSLVILIAGGAATNAVLAAVALLRRRTASGVAATVLATTGFVALVSGNARALDDISAEVRWRSQTAVGERIAAVDTPYQHLDLAEHDGQYDLYSNGSPSLSFPDPWERSAPVHVAMVQHQSGARRILFVGGGVADRVTAALAHDPIEVHYVAPDPAEIELVMPVLSRDDRRALRDPRVRVFHDDGRRLVRRARRARYDVLIVETSDPTTARANRTFTRDFITECRHALADDGILAIRISGAVDFEEDAVAPVASLHSTLRRVFGHVAVWPGVEVRMFAARSPGVVTEDPAVLARRWRDRGLDAPYMSEHRFESLFDPDLVARLHARLATVTPLPNTDAVPTAYLFGLVLWDERARGAEEPSPLWALRRLRTGWVLAPLLALALVRLLWPRRPRRSTAVDGIWMVATGGTCGLALEVVLLLVFQSSEGSLFRALGLLVGLFMLGLVAGTGISTRLVRGSPLDRTRRVALGVDLTTVAVIVTCPLIAGASCAALLVGLWLVAAGLCTGAVFPPALALIRTGRDRGGAWAAGVADAADHLGACAGALTIGVVVVPVAGILGASLALACVKAVSIAGLARRIEPDRS
jgi:spermidine synthase